VHWEESNIYTNKESSEMNLSAFFTVGKANNFFNSIIKSSENGENGSHRENIMKMSYYVVGIVKGNIETGICKNNASDSTYGEEKDETKSK